MSPRLKKLCVIAPIVFLLDQTTKFLIVSKLTEGARVSVLPHFFDIVHFRNPGAAFGAFASLSDSFRLPFFYVTSTIALVVIMIYFLKLEESEKGMQYFLSLILGGALGNIFDRVFRGEVVDFLSFHWYDEWTRFSLGPWAWRFKLEWPAFNIADAAISMGVVCLTYLMLQSKNKE